MRTLLALILTTLALLSTTPASAQRYRQARPMPPRADLSASTRTLEMTLQQSRAPEVLQRQARMLSNQVARDGRRSHQAYMRMRRLMHSSFYQPSDAELDAWYDVAFAWRLRRGANLAPVQPVVLTPPPAPAALLTFNGVIEGTPVFWSAPTHQQLRAQCQASAGQAGFRQVDDIQIFGVAYHNGPSFWDAREICAIVAANARLQRPMPGMVSIEGDIEGAPFHLEGSVAEVHQAALALIPILVGTTNVDDVTINGQRYHNGPGFWSATQVAVMVAQRAMGLSQGAPQTRPPRGDMRRERDGRARRGRGAQTARQASSPW